MTTKTSAKMKKINQFQKINMDIRLTRIRTLGESLYLHYTNMARLYLFAKEIEKCPKKIRITHCATENTKRLFQTIQNLKNQTADLENKLNAVLKFKLFS